MATEKGKKQANSKPTVNFNPSDYDHLDEATLPQWINEFLSRNTIFQKDYKKLCKLALRNDLEGRKQFVELWGKMAELYGGWIIPQKIARFANIPPSKDGIIALPMQPIKHLENVSETVWKQLRPSPDKADTDSLIVIVNTLYTQKEIIASLKTLLHNHSRKETRIRKEWKLYLMVYDIKTQNPALTFEEIGSILSTKGAERPEGYDLRTTKNHYDKAVHLIEGGYKQYL